METAFFTQVHLEALQGAISLHSELPLCADTMEWLDHLPVKVVIADAAGKANFWNKQWYSYTGLPLDYPKNKLWKAALHPDDVQRTYNGMSYSVRTGTELQIDYRLRRASDGLYRWHSAHAYPVKDENNKVCKWIATVTDMQEYKDAEYRKDIFLSVASHELKTPLTTLKTLLHVYKNEALANDGGCPAMLEHAESQLLRIERLVGNLLDVSKINSQNLVYRFEAFNFGDMIKECCERMQQQTGRHTVLLEQNVKILFTGDKLRLEQVMNNLLSNAIKYSPAADKIIVRSFVFQNDVYVSVQDFGIGIAPENIDNIYAAYYRVNNTSAEVQGLGIGLYICSEIIKNHLGKIWVHSVPAQGSTFYFRLPINHG